MNEIDQILSNIDKDDDDNLFPGNGTDSPRNDELTSLINSIDTSAADAQALKNSADQKVSAPDQDIMAETDLVRENPPSARAGLDTASIPQTAGSFSIRGSKSWNQHEPYIIQMDAATLTNDIESLEKSFYFVDEPADQAEIKLKIKQEIVAYLRRPSENVTERYREFIYRLIIASTQEIIRTFKIVQENEKLFIYHIGPLTIFRYIRELFHQNKYGYCYKYLPGNKAARFFPEEYIKDTILTWFEENINILNLSFDSLQKFDEMKKIVLIKYHSDLRLFNARLDQINAKAGHDKNISRHKLFYLKGNEWFGQLEIEIYKRFIGNSIFM
jgi:hypothetical protein